jgi:hypothetical protein
LAIGYQPVSIAESRKLKAEKLRDNRITAAFRRTGGSGG